MDIQNIINKVFINLLLFNNALWLQTTGPGLMPRGKKYHAIFEGVVFEPRGPESLPADAIVTRAIDGRFGIRKIWPTGSQKARYLRAITDFSGLFGLYGAYTFRPQEHVFYFQVIGF